MYDKILEVDEPQMDPIVLSRWSGMSREINENGQFVSRESRPSGKHFQKPAFEESSVLKNELSSNLISPEMQKKNVESSAGFDTFNPSKAQESQDPSKNMMISINEEDSRVQGGIYGTEQTWSMAEKVSGRRFMTKSDDVGFQLKRMPTLKDVDRGKKTPKWKQNLINLRKRRKRKRKIHTKKSSKPRFRLNPKLLRSKKFRKKQLLKKKLRNKAKLKKVLKNYLAQYPWKNKRLFNIRQAAIKKMKKYGTLPGLRLHRKASRGAPNWETYKPARERFYRMWSIKGSPVMKKDIYRSASLGGLSLVDQSRSARSKSSFKSKGSWSGSGFCMWRVWGLYVGLRMGKLFGLKVLVFWHFREIFICYFFIVVYFSVDIHIN